MQEREFAEKYCIFRCRSGSHAYGTSLPTSDVDTRGVFIAPPSHILSCVHKIEQAEDKATDTVIFELKKFMNMAANCNPNIIELLFTDERNILFMHDTFRRIREHAHLFLSRKAKHTFSGYAMSQLQRIKGHNKWINNPQPEQTPSMADFCRFIGTNGAVRRDNMAIRALSKVCFLAKTFGATQFRVYHSPEFFAEKVGFFNENETQPKYVNIDDETLARRATYKGFLWINIDEFKTLYKEWSQYWEWKNNRNEVRAELEARHGYDTKHAMHLVRLMRMAQEILTEGKVIVRRPDAAELLRIRAGEFDYEWLLNWAKEMDEKLNEADKKSELQFAADYEGIDALYRETVLQYWREHKLLNYA
jgi:hypothetical protein